VYVVWSVGVAWSLFPVGISPCFGISTSRDPERSQDRHIPLETSDDFHRALETSDGVHWDVYGFKTVVDSIGQLDTGDVLSFVATSGGTEYNLTVLGPFTEVGC